MTYRHAAILPKITVELSCLHENSYIKHCKLSSHLLHPLELVVAVPTGSVGNPWLAIYFVVICY